MTEKYILEEKNLLDRIVKAVQSKGITGEEQPIKTLTLICVGKKTKNKEPYSTTAHVEDESSIGKDYLVKKLGKIVFWKDWIFFDSPSKTAVTYSQRKKEIKDEQTKEEKWIPEGIPITEQSIVYISDATDEFLNSEDCKMLTGGDVNTQRTIDGHSVLMSWEKAVVIITSAQTSKGEQMVTRAISIKLDETEKQTEEIKDFNLERKCGVNFKNEDGMIVEHPELVDEVKRCFYDLEEVYVDLQQVQDLIKEKIPKSRNVKMRRLSSRLYDLISFSATLHQCNRNCIGFKSERDENFKVIEANEQDVDIGFAAFNASYKTDISDLTFLNKRQTKILKRLKKESPKQYSIAIIQTWSEAEGVSYNTLSYTDLPRIMQENPDVQIDEEKRPKTYYYAGRLEPKPATEKSTIIPEEFDIDLN